MQIKHIKSSHFFIGLLANITKVICWNPKITFMGVDYSYNNIFNSQIHIRIDFNILMRLRL